MSNHSLRIPLSAIPSSQVSFTYTDSFATYVDRDLAGNPIPRKPQYGSVFRLEELDGLFREYGWPGERWKNESSGSTTFYVKAQIWSDDPLKAYIAEAEQGRITSRCSGPGGRRGPRDSRVRPVPARPLNVGPLALRPEPGLIRRGHSARGFGVAVASQSQR